MSNQWIGAARLASQSAANLVKIGTDRVAEALGGALPRTREQIATPLAVNRLLESYPPEAQRTLPPVRSVRLPGVDFESSNCTNFLIELEFESGDLAAGSITDSAELPKTAYVKIPCDEITTRVFGNTIGFWPLEVAFCQRVAHHIPIRVPRVYAAAQKGARFVLLLENLHEIPGVQLFINRDMAAGTTPERAERVLRAFAQMHAKFWGSNEAEREALLPLKYNTYLAPRYRRMSRAMNASAIGPALKAAPDILPERIGETYRRTMERWDAVLDAWYQGPLTLVHGDSHLGNCFEYPEDGETRVGMIDFQATHWSKGIRDVQYFLINSLEPDVLAENEAALIQVYCDALAQQGVTLGRSEAFEQYRAFSFQTLMVGVVPLGLGNLTERDETVRAITRRSAIAVERLGFRDWLDGLG